MDVAEHERWWSASGRAELNALLVREWDPIGIARIADGPEEEYEHYAGLLVRRLRAGASEPELAAVLEGFRSEMGLEASDEPPLATAGLIRDWYMRSTAAWRSGPTA